MILDVERFNLVEVGRLAASDRLVDDFFLMLAEHL